jgi:plasmid stability protein
MQYTIRDVPDRVDRALRERAQNESKSLNEVAIEALSEGVGVSDEPIVRRDLSDIAKTWKKDPVFEEVLEEQDQIDEMLWK